jgi:hypothetical protein
MQEQNPEVEIVEADSPQEHADAPQDADNLTPRGTLMFVLILITFYALYWFLLWFEVFVQRGS